MYTKEEKQYLALTEKLRTQLNDIEQQITDLTAQRNREIEELMSKRNQLKAVLNGQADLIEEEVYAETPEENYTDEESNLLNLVDYIKRNQGINRARLVDVWLPSDMDAKDLSNLLARGRRRGLLIVEGKSRAALWYAAE